MNISTLCDKIELQPQIEERVLSFIEDFDFRTVDELQKGYFIYENMKETLTQTQTTLGEDTDGIKILSCMLKASADAYVVYQKMGIPDEIYFATMKCFPRFIAETYKMTGELCFDRFWWTTRQAGCHLFRIGELEYEIKRTEKEPSSVYIFPLTQIFLRLLLKSPCRMQKDFSPSIILQTTFVKGENYLLFSYFHGMGYELQSVRFMGAVVNHVNTTKNKKFIKKTWTLHFTKSRSNFIMRMRTCRSCVPHPGKGRCLQIP